VAEARERQYHRFGKEITNGRVPYETLLQASPLSEPQQQFLQKLTRNMGGAIERILKLFELHEQSQTWIPVKRSPSSIFGKQ
jgi:magnesium chelatase family protein